MTWLTYILDYDYTIDDRWWTFELYFSQQTNSRQLSNKPREVMIYRDFRWVSSVCKTTLGIVSGNRNNDKKRISFVRHWNVKQNKEAIKNISQRVT